MIISEFRDKPFYLLITNRALKLNFKPINTQTPFQFNSFLYAFDSIKLKKFISRVSST